MLLPRVCPVCGEVGDAPCGACRRLLVPAGPLPAPAGVGRCAAVLRYEGAGRVLVTALKYRNRRSVVPWLASTMAGLVPERPDVVTWVPCLPGRRGRRGFDQGEVLARRVAREIGVPARPLLRRRGTTPQTALDARRRRAGPDLISRRCTVGHAVVVDDVLTTGASLAAAAAALRRGGVGRVDAVVAAWTPFKDRPMRADD